MTFAYSEFSIQNQADYTLPIGYEGQNFHAIKSFHELFRQSLEDRYSLVSSSPLQELPASELDLAARAILNPVATRSKMVVQVVYQDQRQGRFELPMVLNRMLDANSQNTAGAELRSLSVSGAPNGITLRIFK
jgi:hypothetical protein